MKIIPIFAVLFNTSALAFNSYHNTSNDTVYNCRHLDDCFVSGRCATTCLSLKKFVDITTADLSVISPINQIFAHPTSPSKVYWESVAVFQGTAASSASFPASLLALQSQIESTFATVGSRPNIALITTILISSQGILATDTLSSSPLAPYFMSGFKIPSTLISLNHAISGDVDGSSYVFLSTIIATTTVYSTSSFTRIITLPSKSGLVTTIQSSREPDTIQSLVFPESTTATPILISHLPLPFFTPEVPASSFTEAASNACLILTIAATVYSFSWSANRFPSMAAAIAIPSHRPTNSPYHETHATHSSDDEKHAVSSTLCELSSTITKSPLTLSAEITSTKYPLTSTQPPPSPSKKVQVLIANAATTLYHDVIQDALVLGVAILIVL